MIEAEWSPPAICVWHSNTTIAYALWATPVTKHLPSLKFIKKFSVGLLLPSAFNKAWNFLTTHLFLMMYFRSPLLLVFTFLCFVGIRQANPASSQVINNQEWATLLNSPWQLEWSFSVLIWEAFKPATGFNNSSLKGQANYNSKLKFSMKVSLWASMLEVVWLFPHKTCDGLSLCLRDLKVSGYNQGKRF